MLALAIAAAALALQLLAFHDLRHDDAYVTYRYGQNLASGNGLVFNPGERIMGSTSPAFALLSGLVYAVCGKQALPSIMAGVGCLAWIAQALALFFMLRRGLGELTASVVALAVALGAAESARWVALETNAAVALTLWAIVLAQRERWLASAGIAAMAGLVRPDALLVAALIAVSSIGRLRSSIWKPAAVFAAIILPWVVFASAYFGSPLPQSAVTKYQQVRFTEYLAHSLRAPAAAFLPLDPSPALAAAAWLLALAGAAFVVRKDRRLWIVPVYGAAHLAAYCLLRPYTQHTWHLYPATLVFVALALCAIAATIEAPRHRVIRALSAAILLALASGYGVRTGSLARSHTTGYWNGARDSAYRDTARFLLAHTRPGDIVASEEVGTLGYYTELPMYDLGGLVTVDPTLRPPAPGLRWFVASQSFLKRPQDTRPTRIFEADGFRAFVFPLGLGSQGTKKRPL
jgi:hypothetical protein